MSLAETYLKDAVTIVPKGSLNAYGVYDYTGTPVVTVARVKDEVKQMRTIEGREVMYTRVAYLNHDETIVVGDRVTFSSVDHEVVALYRVDDLNNDADHIRVFLNESMT